MTEQVREFVEAQKAKLEPETVKTQMKKKPTPAELKTKPAIKLSMDEKEKSKAALEKVKSQNKKSVMLPKGYSREWEKEKVAMEQRKVNRANL
ncbi:hypothetical protein D1632_15545 [Chryseobacterium nematophagum]|uniref:Uncharacterized protein n=1 Tax=Chryseobacterium nematophagum TaxID=2305228 RepID=A0A3M7L892_9FLAO|nr:hypothetical protein [Chryseobacterium nematophagum]RMZ58978.1 hypothetical protein D1632_15545 [Chryseobacterium nematophagum]